MRNAVARSERVYLYWGTAESSTSANASTWWPPFLDGYDIYLSQGYHVGGDFVSVVGCGLAHNEAAWASQVGNTMRFLLDINDTPNELAYLDTLPTTSIVVDPEASIELTYPALSGYRYQFEATNDLNTTEPWEIVTVQSTDRFWQTLTVSAAIDLEDAQGFYRIQVITP